MATEPENPNPPSEQVPVLSSKSGSPQALSEEMALLYEIIGDGHLLTLVVLTGATPLIPVPFLDDVAKGYLERRLLRSLAEAQQMKLSSEEVDRFTYEVPKGCCAMGCLGKAVRKVIFYPIKKIVRKIFFFLEIKRAIDLSSLALAESWLFALALRRGFWSPGRDPAEADRLREVIEAACRGQGVKPLEAAFQGVFAGAKSTFFDFARRFTGRPDDSKEKLDAAVDKLEQEEKEMLARLSAKLKEAISGVSEGYLQRFAEGFEKELERAMARPADQKPPAK